MQKQEFLRLGLEPASAEFLVMGYLMRRSIPAYKVRPRTLTVPNKASLRKFQRSTELG